jgi:hypothetical protein
MSAEEKYYQLVKETNEVMRDVRKCITDQNVAIEKQGKVLGGIKDALVGIKLVFGQNMEITKELAKQKTELDNLSDRCQERHAFFNQTVTEIKATIFQSQRNQNDKIFAFIIACVTGAAGALGMYFMK